MLTCLIQKKFSSLLTQWNPSGDNIYPSSILVSLGRAATQQHPCNWSHSMSLHVVKAAPDKVTRSVEARPIWDIVAINFPCLYPFHYVWQQQAAKRFCHDAISRVKMCDKIVLSRQGPIYSLSLGMVLSVFLYAQREWLKTHFNFLLYRTVIIQIISVSLINIWRNKQCYASNSLVP